MTASEERTTRPRRRTGKASSEDDTATEGSDAGSGSDDRPRRTRSSKASGEGEGSARPRRRAEDQERPRRRRARPAPGSEDPSAAPTGGDGDQVDGDEVDGDEIDEAEDDVDEDEGDEAERDVDQEPTPEPEPAKKRIPARKIARWAAEQVMEMTGKESESVTSVRRSEEGWSIGLEVVESHRIPSSTDILAIYEAEMDDEGELISYRRVSRYNRNRGDDQ